MKFSTLPVCLMSSLALLIPTTVNAGGTCDDYPFVAKETKLVNYENGLGIQITQQVAVFADDADVVDMAMEEAEASGRVAVKQFIEEKIESRKDFSNKAVQNMTLNSDGKKGSLEKTKTQLKEMSLAASGLQRGVVTLGSCYTPGKYVRVTVGLKPDTVMAAGKMDATMSGPFKKINEPTDTAGNMNEDATPSDPMGPYNTIKGYSGINTDF